MAAQRVVDNRLVGPLLPVADDLPVRAILTDAGRDALGVAA
jgi:hypothetical protein